MSKLSHIARGWYNFAKAEPYIKQLMDYRLAICDTCPNKQQLNTAGQLLVKLINQEGSLFKCAKCKCPLSSKTADPGSECPIGKWGIAGTEPLN